MSPVLNSERGVSFATIGNESAPLSKICNLTFNMNDEFSDLPEELGSDVWAREWTELTDAPHHLGELPDGTETVG
jgi:hypothetical protein